jgi:peroxiredoxin Q/BCP
MIAVGTQAPGFELTSDTGEDVKLSDYLGKKVILYFYPKALTKG